MHSHDHPPALGAAKAAQLGQAQRDANRLYVLAVGRALGGLTATEAEEESKIHARRYESLEAFQAERRRQLEDPYAAADLPPLLPPLSAQPGSPNKYDPLRLRAFYDLCEERPLEEVRCYVDGRQRSEFELQRALGHAALGGQVPTARYLLQMGAVLHGAVVESACHRRSLPLFELCVEYGWHPNQQIPSTEGSFGVALPHCADNAQITRFLLDKGADPNLAAFPPRMRSALGPTPPMDRKSGAALNAAAAHGSVAVVAMLLGAGANPDYATPLHEALHAWPASRPVIEYLLREGVDVNKVKQSIVGGGTPLAAAIVSGRSDAVKLLLEHGARVQDGAPQALPKGSRSTCL